MTELLPGASIRSDRTIPTEAAEPAFLAPEREADPAQLFADHVDFVRTHGDGLDHHRRYLQMSGGIPLQAVGAVVAGEAIAVGSDIPAAWVPTSLTAVGIGAATWTVRKYFNWRRDDAYRGGGTQDAIGEQYELYRVPNHETGQDEVVMRWYGTLPGKGQVKGKATTHSRPRDESLKLLADLAEENDISTVLVGPELLDKDLNAAHKTAYASEPVANWLEANKGIRPRFTFGKYVTHPTVLSFTPARLKQFSEDVKYERAHSPGIGNVIEVLRSRQPKHPLVQKFDDFGGRIDGRAEDLRRSARRCLEFRLNDTTSIFSRGDDAQRNPERQRVHLESRVGVAREGKVDHESVEWRGTGKHFTMPTATSDLYQSLGINKNAIPDIMENPDDHPDKTVVMAAECAVYQHSVVDSVARRRKDTIMPIGVQQYPISTCLRSSLDGFFKQPVELSGTKFNVAMHIDIRRRQVARLLAAIGIVGAIGFGMNELDSGWHHEADTLIADSDEVYAHQHHISPDHLTEAERQAARDHALDGHRVLRWYTDERNALHAELKKRFAISQIGGNSQPASGMSGLNFPQEGVRNVPPSPEEADIEWKITASGNISTAGYWGVNTGAYFDRNGIWRSYGTNDAKVSFSPESMPRENSPEMHDYIQISRNLGPNDVLYDSNLHMTTLNPPILAGTHPIAANYNGEPIQVIPLANGTYMFELPKGTPTPNGLSALTYWLAKGGDTPHAVSGIGIDGKVNAFPAIRSLWDEAIPGLSIKYDQDRAEAEAAYIRDQFSYTRTPLSAKIEQEMKAGELDYTGFVQDALRSKQAICSSAASVVAIDNPSVNVAWGYRDNGDGKLTAGEAHMWDVDTTGKIIDPTPSRIYNFTQDVRQQSPNMRDDLLNLELFGLLGASIVGNWARRESAQQRAALSKKIAGLRLNRIPTESLVWAKQVADQAAYAPGFDLSKLPQVRQELTREAALADVSKHQVHSRYVRDRISDTIAAGTRREKQVLKKARRIIAAVRKAGLAHVVPEAE